jgi:Protein of unknown function (DUF1598)
MQRNSPLFILRLAVAAACLACVPLPSVHAQFGGGILGAGGVGGGGLGGFGGVLGQGGVGGQAGQGGQQGVAGGGVAGGIMIDAQGVVRPVYSKLRSAKLQQLRVAALARKLLPADVNTPSKLRKVSLVELEKACEEYAKNRKHVPADIQYMAGLQRIDYVFVDPDRKDLIIAGPAEGFAPDSTGRVVGVSTGHPPLRLDHLINALRALQSGDNIGCSIDPVDKNLRETVRYIRTNSTPASRPVARSRFGVMAKILGMQNIRVWGVPAESHFGQMMVEADYRMKRISMGLERPGVRGFHSHLSLLGRTGNSMQRWWFVPLYDAFLTTADGNAFQLAGQRLQLLSQEELPTGTGQRVDSATTRLSTKNYAKHFTQMFPKLAEKVPVFAELQNLVDAAVVAAIFRQKRLPEKVGWKMPLFLDKERATIVKGYAPKQVHSIFSYKDSGRSVVGLIGGGVVIHPLRTARSIKYETVTRGTLIEHRGEVMRKKLRPEKHPWWWD